ncbi:macrophage mannose receptor 1-like isoform X6, partial [Clarias magur]
SISGANSFIGVSSPLMTWAGAQTYCRTFHTDLASALSQTDNDLLAQVASVQGVSWFGLFRDTWKWLNSTPAVNVPWYTGRPDNSRANSNCGTLRYGQFVDEPCSINHYFFCQTVPVNQQVVKLRMKSDGNVFDSAVQSAVLEQ